MKTICVFVVLSVLSFSNLFADPPKFKQQIIDLQIQIGYGLAIGDVDGDHKDDILLADKSQIVWYKNPGTPENPWTKSVMARNLTQRDNVCLAARDIDGDGKVEVAVGAQWNPGETSDTKKSGALFFLKRGEDPTNPWTPMPITPHDPTTHRMHWLKNDQGKFEVAVLPLHGLGNKSGKGEPVRLAAYAATDANYETWTMRVLNASLHMTHNFDLLPAEKGDHLLVGGSEGIQRISSAGKETILVSNPQSRGAGEVRQIDMTSNDELVAIEPMHGNEVVYYERKSDTDWLRTVVDGSLNQGHALATGDLLGNGGQQVVAGWRGRDSNGKVGIKLYVPNKSRTTWEAHIVDDNSMACEDLKVADLDGNGKLDIIAAGRATKNVKVYWNQ